MATGFSADAGYRPVVRDGGTAGDRVSVLLGEIASSLSLIKKAREAASNGGRTPATVEPLKGSGVGECESPHGGLEYRVFLTSEGKVIRARAASAAGQVAQAAPGALKGALFENAAATLVSLSMCAACAAHGGREGQHGRRSAEVE
jgi:Ni,Fe-hydrogenase III large subunit